MQSQASTRPGSNPSAERCPCAGMRRNRNRDSQFASQSQRPSTLSSSWAAAAFVVPLLRTLAATAGAVPTVPSESPGSFDPAAVAWEEPRVLPQSLELAAAYRLSPAR